VNSNFMSIIPKFLNMSIISIFMTEKESSRNGAAISISSIRGKYFLINLPILIIDRIVKRQYNHLRGLFWFQLSGNLSPVCAAEAVRQSAVVGIAPDRCVGIVFWVTIGLIGGIRAINLALNSDTRR